MLRDHGMRTVDVGIPLGVGLRSFARVSGGFIEYHTVKPENPALTQMNISITGGSIQRAEDGSLIALIESRSPMRTINEFLAKNKLTVIEVKSQDKFLSTDPSSPSLFYSRVKTIFPAGDLLLDVSSWKEVVIPFDLHVEIDFEAVVVLNGESVEGEVRLTSRFDSGFALQAQGSVRILLS
jgi:hypothetical protein